MRDRLARFSLAVIAAAFLMAPSVSFAQANPCAAKNPRAANPCAAKNPCVSNPCAPKGKTAKKGSAKGKQQAQNPCAANPCAANPCAAKKK